MDCHVLSAVAGVAARQFDRGTAVWRRALRSAWQLAHQRSPNENEAALQDVPWFDHRAAGWASARSHQSVATAAANVAEVQAIGNLQSKLILPHSLSACSTSWTVAAALLPVLLFGLPPFGLAKKH